MPEALTLPLRSLLLDTLLAELMARLKHMASVPASMDRAQKEGLLNEQHEWVMRKWNSKDGCWHPDTARASMSMEATTALLQQLRQGFQDPHRLLRFHVTRPLASDMGKEKAVMLLEVSLRGQQSDILHEGLQKLCSHPATGLIRHGDGARSLEQIRPFATSAAPAGRLSFQASAGSRSHCLLSERAASAVCTMLRSCLLNPGNICYINAFALSLTWTLVHLQPPSALPSPISSLLHSLGTAGRVLLTGIPEWAYLLQAWPDPHVQHDIAEFAAYALPRLLTSEVHGAWEARRQASGVLMVTDRTEGACVLIAEIPQATPCTVQHVIDAWHDQSSRHAFSRPPRLLVLELKRYRMAGADFSKDRRPVRFAPSLRVPVFEASGALASRPATYRLRASNIHLGATPGAGHYQTVLRCFSEGESPRAFQTAALLTDDGRSPGITQWDSHERDSYLLWYCLALEHDQLGANSAANSSL